MSWKRLADLARESGQRGNVILRRVREYERRAGRVVSRQTVGGAWEIETDSMLDPGGPRDALAERVDALEALVARLQIEIQARKTW